MKNAFNSFLLCISMYSVIRLPRAKWEATSMKYIFCFIPLIGILIGLVESGWYFAAIKLSLSLQLYSAVAIVLPLFITGFIHMDGFIDTCDAFSSRGDFEKKQHILKDPHVGAFGIIYAIVYCILYFGLFCEFYLRECSVLILGAGFILSRAGSCLSSVWIIPSKDSGLLRLFTDSSHKKIVAFTMFGYFAGVFILLFLFGSLKIFVITVSLTLLFFIWFRWFSLKHFGGISGDLAGFFIQLYEILFIAAIIIGSF